MAKRFNRIFTLTDGKTARKACFKMPDTETGTRLAIMAGKLETDTTSNVAVEIAKTAARHIVLLPDDNVNMEQEIQSLQELDYIFENPFLGVQLIQEFMKDLDPLINPSVKLSPSSAEGNQS